ncbi:MAG: molybdenum cofactor biosynthesis protein B [Porticoccaceae bacterium]
MAVKNFRPLGISILTVSDTRNADTDTSGNFLAESVKAAGHNLIEKVIAKDDVFQIRAIISSWIADSAVNAIITTGGTGFYPRDVTPEAISPLFDKPIEGFGELFRAISYEEIGTSTIQSRAFGGMANNTCIFCLPGSQNACKTGWNKIISEQLDSRTKPCNFVGHLLGPE